MSIRCLGPFGIGLLMVTSVIAGDESRWRKLPFPQGRSEGIRSIAMQNDTLWAMVGNGVFTWNGNQWKRPKGPALRGGTYAAGLVGGNDRDLYCTQQGEQGTGLLYRLRDNQIERVAEYPYPRSTNRPYFYVSKSGRVFQMLPDGRVGLLNGESWTYYQAGKSRPVIFEFDGLVCICFPLDRKMLRFRHGGLVATGVLQLKFPNQTRGIRMIKWGDRFALAFQRSQPRVQCIDLETGKATRFATNIGVGTAEPVDFEQLDEKLGPRSVEGGFSTRDGSAWLLRRRAGTPGYQLDRLFPNGSIKTITTPDPMTGQDYGLRRTPRGVLESRDGSVWFGLNNSILRLDGESFTRFQRNTGYDLSVCHMIEDPRGTVYAANGGLYAFYRNVSPPKNLPPPRLALISQTERWRFRFDNKDQFAAAWMNGDSVMLAGARTPLLAVSVDSGKELYRQPLSTSRSPSIGAIPWQLNDEGDGETIDYAMSDEIVRVKRFDGTIEDRFPLSRDYRIVPIRVPDGFVVVPTYRGRELIRTGKDGTVKWTRSLPGYLMSHAVIDDDLIVMQTRAGSYGGQMTLGVDLDDGSVRWQDQTDAYGAGLAFGDDGRLIIETDDWLSPKRTESWTIARDREGNRVWHHREEEQRSSFPIVDEDSQRVYSILSRGKVICLSMKDGQVLWEQTLTEGLPLPISTSYYPSWSPHSLYDGKLLVVDRSHALNVLDTNNGQVLARVALSGDSPAPSGSPGLIAPPWINSDSILSAFKHEVVAIPLPDALKQTPPVAGPMIAACPAPSVSNACGPASCCQAVSRQSVSCRFKSRAAGRGGILTRLFGKRMTVRRCR